MAAEKVSNYYFCDMSQGLGFKEKHYRMNYVRFIVPSIACVEKSILYTYCDANFATNIPTRGLFARVPI